MADTVTDNPTVAAFTGTIDLSRPHFVGIGGTAMSGLAQVCAARGSQVSGTDAADSDRLPVLRAAGCEVTIGHDPRTIDGASCVVYTTVAAHAPEITAARAAGIPVVHRAQVLATLTEDQPLIAVAGTHGKSTTTAMIVAAQQRLGADPSFVIGADLDTPGSGARHGRDRVFVAEADESDRALHFLTPYTAIVTGIAHDHPENYDGLDDHIYAYVSFASRIRHGGNLIVSADDPASMHMTGRVRRLRPDLRIFTFGHAHTADVRIVAAERDGWHTQVFVDANGEKDYPAIHLDSPSAHHALNAVAAMAVLVGLGTGSWTAADAVSAFTGVRRRFTKAGEAAGVTVVDCHAGHHNEIAADLQAAHAVAGSRGGKVIAVVQPSGYARVRAFGRQMGAMLATEADTTVLLDIHGTAPIPGVSSTLIGDAAIAAGGNLRYTSRTEAPALISCLAASGDVVVLLGTGDITTLATPLLRAIKQKTTLTV